MAAAPAAESAAAAGPPAAVAGPPAAAGWAAGRGCLGRSLRPRCDLRRRRQGYERDHHCCDRRDHTQQFHRISPWLHVTRRVSGSIDRPGPQPQGGQRSATPPHRLPVSSSLAREAQIARRGVGTSPAVSRLASRGFTAPTTGAPTAQSQQAVVLRQPASEAAPQTDECTRCGRSLASRSFSHSPATRGLDISGGPPDT